MIGKGIDIKFALTILLLVGSIGGFYFTTSYRIEALEAKVSSLQEKQSSDGATLIRLEERVKQIQDKTNETYNLLRDVVSSHDDN